jgi:hypothetical protein
MNKERPMSITSVLASVFLRPVIAVLGLLLLGVPVGSFILASPVAAAEETAAVEPAGDLPSAEEVMNRYVEVTGGEEAYGKIQNRVVHGTFELAKQGIKGDVTIYSARPNLLYSVILVDALGKIERGSDGQTAWEKSDMTGPVIKAGQEKVDMLRDATFDRLVAWRETYAAAENTGTATVNGEVCDKLKMTPAEGHPQHLYFARGSGLLVRLDATVDSQADTLTVESYLNDYQVTDGIHLPRDIRIKVMGQERRLINNRVEHNVDLMEDLFKLPADVQALMEQQAGSEGGQ